MLRETTFWIVIACCLGVLGPISCKRFEDLETSVPPKTTENDCVAAYHNIVLLRPNEAGDGSDWVDEAVFMNYCPSWPLPVVTCLGTTKKPKGLDQCVMIFPEGGELPETEEGQGQGAPKEILPAAKKPRPAPSRRRRPTTIRMRDL